MISQPREPVFVRCVATYCRAVLNAEDCSLVIPAASLQFGDVTPLIWECRHTSQGFAPRRLRVRLGFLDKPAIIGGSTPPISTRFFYGRVAQWTEGCGVQHDVPCRQLLAETYVECHFRVEVWRFDSFLGHQFYAERDVTGYTVTFG